MTFRNSKLLPNFRVHGLLFTSEKLIIFTFENGKLIYRNYSNRKRTQTTTKTTNYNKPPTNDHKPTVNDHKRP